jgi:hypothetical protein
MPEFDGIGTYLAPKVRIYRNLNNGKLSMQKYIKGKGWRVDDHPEGVHLRDCEFLVYEKGRQRVLKEKRKNVHAYIQGILVRRFDSNKEDIHFHPEWSLEFCEAHYNPYKSSWWLDDDGYPIEEADAVVVTSDGRVTARRK